MRTNHRLTVASAAWAAACVGACVVDRPSAPAFWAALVGSLSLVTANLVSAAGSGKRRLARVGRLALAVGLYALVFPTSHALLGPGHFAVPAEAGAGGWVVFTLAHLLRAADAIDLLDFWGHPIQSVRHTSPLAAGLLVGFHLLTGAFVIEGAVRAAARVQKAIFGNDVLRSIQLNLVVVAAGAGFVLCPAAFLGITIGGLFSPPPEGYDWGFNLGLVAGTVASLVVASVTRKRLGGTVLEKLESAMNSGGQLPPGVAIPRARDTTLGVVDSESKGRRTLTASLVDGLASVVKGIGSFLAIQIAFLSVISMTAGSLIYVGYVLMLLGATDVWKGTRGVWLAEQALRGADFADIMQLFSLRVYDESPPDGAIYAAIGIRTAASAVVGLALYKLRQLLVRSRVKTPEGELHPGGSG